MGSPEEPGGAPGSSAGWGCGGAAREQRGEHEAGLLHPESSLGSVHRKESRKSHFSIFFLLFFLFFPLLPKSSSTEGVKAAGTEHTSRTAIFHLPTF